MLPCLFMAEGVKRKLNVWYCHPYLNHAVGVYIINFAEIAYHQHGVLYIIIAKAIQPTVDDIRLRR